MTIDELEREIKDVYLLNDTGVIRIMLATIIANKISPGGKPVWLMLLAGSSSGKTALLQTLDKIGDWIVTIDTLTTNTFASGLQRSEETSLLWKANHGILVFKDFTTITSMNEEGLKEIMGQLRAIYDGTFDKKTGNNVDTAWHGKIGIIGGGTISVQRKMRQYSENGERFINYIIGQADPIEVTHRAIKNQKNLKEKEDLLAELVGEFVRGKLETAPDETMRIPQDIINEMVEVANFTTLARSPVLTDSKTGQVVFVPDREMPPRVAMMFTNMAMTLMHISNETELSRQNSLILYKCGMDSIPVDRRMILRLLAQFKHATTKNLAIKLNYPTDPIRNWCNQLNALKMITRVQSGKNDIWTLRPEYKKTVLKYENLIESEQELEPTQEELMMSGLQEEEQDGYGYDSVDEKLLNEIDIGKSKQLLDEF